MKDSKGRGIVRLGDMTTHGGKVIKAVSDFKVHGRPVAVDGDMTFCPKCRGTFPIKPSHSERTHNGKEVAFDGHRTACGAKLISSI